MARCAGSHGWKAAKEVGLEEIPCEVIDADDFEAMRQTYKRNQHGTHHSVLQGRMFRRMMADRGLSQRAFAKDVEVSEGTVRNSLLYAEAADLRNDYAATLPRTTSYLAERPVLASARSNVMCWCSFYEQMIDHCAAVSKMKRRRA